MSVGEGSKGKVEIKIGNLSFSAEGEQNWLSEQLVKVLAAASATIDNTNNGVESKKGDAGAETSRTPVGSLSSYLKAKGGESVQVQRFLATAGWLHHRGTEKLTTTVVTAALSENHQKRLGNTAECLNQNVGKGFCEKTKDGFYITPEGWKALGEER